MIRLGVNIDHVATVRQARRADEPDPLHAALLALLGGADGRLGVQAVEIQTARYAEARGAADREQELAALREAAAEARDRGLHVHMGHGLTYTNVQAVAAIPGVEELNIGHSIVARAILV